METSHYSMLLVLTEDTTKVSGVLEQAGVEARRLDPTQEICPLAPACQAVSKVRIELEDRKIIERAKGILMHYHQLSEPEAHKSLQRLATERNRKVRDIAEAIVAAERIFRELISEMPHHI